MVERCVRIIDTGCSNSASLIAALEREGVSTSLTRDAAAIAQSAAVVLPGVGTFGDAMQSLEGSDLPLALAERLEAGRATLCICVGMQVLAESSEESPGVAGLGLVPGRLRAFPPGVRSPQIGWNQVTRDGRQDADAPLGEAYFVNSYRLIQAPRDWDCLWSDHGAPFIAAIQRGAFLGTQFHPELSDHFGQALLRDWLQLAFPEAP